MYGAIIGDMAGSIYEYDEFQENSKKIINLKRRLDCLNNNILSKESFYSDDTILTIAVLDSIINNISFENNLRKYGLENKDKIPQNIKYFKYMFSPNFIKWCSNNEIGVSNGNGCIMRISPVGYLFNIKEDIIKYSELVTRTSHNSKLSIESANIVALMIYYFRSGFSKEKVFNLIEKEYKININYSLNDLQQTNMFDGTCNVLGKLLYIIKISNNFDDAIKYTLSIGGDTDTNACIVGSICESLYGIKDEYKNFVNDKIPSKYVALLNNGYKKIKILR